MITRNIVEVENIGVFQCKVMLVCGDSETVKEAMIRKGLKESFLNQYLLGLKMIEYLVLILYVLCIIEQ